MFKGNELFTFPKSGESEGPIVTDLVSRMLLAAFCRWATVRLLVSVVAGSR